MPPAAPAPAPMPTPQPEAVEIDGAVSSRPQKEPAKKKAPGSKFSDYEVIFISLVAIAFGIIAIAEVTAPVLGFIEAMYYRKKGLSSTVWLLSFGVGALLGLVPILNIFVYVINFWVVVYVDRRHPNLEKVADKTAKVAGKVGGGPGGPGPNAPVPLQHEVSPTNIQHEVAAPAEAKPAPAGGTGRNGEDPRKRMNALEEQERDMYNPEAKEEEDLFNKSPDDPFAARHQREREAEEDEERRVTQAKEEAERREKEEDIEQRANTGKAFLRSLERDLNNPVESGDIAPPDEIPEPENIIEEEGSEQEEEPEDGQTIHLKKAA